MPFLVNLDGVSRDGEDNLTDEYDQNDEAANDGFRNYLGDEGENDENCDDDYGDEDDMQKFGAMTDESAAESEERHKGSNPEHDFRSSFESASASSSSSD
jgi:hypothetical protein